MDERIRKEIFPSVIIIGLCALLLAIVALLLQWPAKVLAIAGLLAAVTGTIATFSPKGKFQVDGIRLLIIGFFLQYIAVLAS